MAEADASTRPPAQYGQSSRKNKRAWRKNVDLTEVQEGLEKVRDDMIINGAIVAELPSSDLFTADSVGEPSLRDRAAKKRKLLRADEILGQRSAVPALKGRAKSFGNLTNGIIEKKETKSSVSGREYERLRRIAYGGQTVRKEVVEESHFSVDFDPWADTAVVEERKRITLDGSRRNVDKEIEEQLGEASFLEKKKELKEPATLKVPPISMAVNGKQVKAVRKPAAEKSYNPTFEDWSNRLDRLGAREVEAEAKRLEAEEKETEHQRRLEQTRREEEEDVVRGLDNSDWESEWDGIQSEVEGEVPEWLGKKRPERKTPTQRNKAKRRKEEEALKKHERRMREKEQQSERIKKLAKEVREKAQLREERGKELVVDDAESSDDGDDMELRRILPFGKRLPEPRLEVLLPEDLPDSLRRLKPEGNALHDRYRSLLLQGKVEARSHAPAKKKERKMTEKWSYKDWRLT